MNLSKTTLILFATSFLAAVGFAAEDYTLPNGRVLRDAYIMERKPNGVSVAHSTGVMFIKYKDMSPELRKKLGYDKEADEKYQKQVHQQQKLKQEKAAREKAENDKIRKKRQANIEKYEITELEDKIKATELHIERLKKEIPKMEADSKTYLDDAVKLSGSGSGSSENNGFWRNGFWTSGGNRAQNANRTDVKDRHRAARAVGNEYSKTKFRLESSKDTLEKEILELDKMKRRLKKLKKEQTSKNKGGFFSNLF